MMPSNNLFDKPTYDKVVRAYQERGRTVIERVPEADEISTYLDQLSIYSKLPLADRFYFSQRDGTVAIYHRIGSIIVSLLNVTQDYTFRCADTYTDGWETHFMMDKRSSVRDPSLLPKIVPLFDDLQRFILCSNPSYLHQVRCDTFKNPRTHASETVYTVEIAHRYHREREPQMAVFDASTWPSENDYSRKRATPSQITLWAMSALVSTDPRLDQKRLDIIHTVIATASCTPNQAPVVIPPGNALALLRVRHAKYMDGRARYANLRSVSANQALLTGQEKLNAPDNYGPSYVQESEKLPQTMSNLDVITKVLAASILTASLGFLYLLRLHDPNADTEEVVGISLAIIGILFPATLVVWLRVFTGSTAITGLVTLRRPLPVDDLYNQNRNSNSRIRVDIATSCAAVKHFNGRWLSFSGLSFNQNGKEFPGRFALADLLKAGYQTTFALDGREVLISPCGERRMRMKHIDEKGFAVFYKPDAHQVGNQDDDVAKGMEILPCARGVWAAYTPVK